ncbi:MAG: ABC transporter ATP-binding protein [Desulfofustis sp.]|nr:ABC transporter ATP-binding protein [Desulfofustis sp.]MBT8354666.1 ABC transporter ATP-binding protein [Desulfofustis sp.]NNK15062.1 ABC transporter ATP-binding protein [Desulfofustis sp.]NNK56960.1 ABC transporter ATP-binding protein [Desulfofustis sp.]
MHVDLSVKNVSKHFKSFTAVDDVSFEVEKGKFFSILGPSGCGKTTLLRMIAGFEEPSAGSIYIGAQDMAEIPPNKRPVNLIFQHLALFPMMNVADNIGFGLARRKESKAEIRKKVADILERVNLPGFGPKKIHQLSGGQKQRVAIARSLVLDPTALLLDEPLGALDLKLREQMKIELKKLQVEVGTTFVYITHDQSEALVMSDHVAVMNEGKFEQIDSPQNLYSRPASPFVARFVGNNNCLAGTCVGYGDGLAQLQFSSGEKIGARTDRHFTTGVKAELFIRPESIIIEPEKELPELNRMQVAVSSILFDGANSQLLVTSPALADEMLISLPQNRQYEHIAAGDRIEIGWDVKAGNCFEVQ